MDTYHGTSMVIAAELVKGSVDVGKGGGELGLGFYTGEHLYLAKSWAFHVSGDKQNNVVQFSTPETQIDKLSIEILSHATASLKRCELRSRGATRTYRFGVDMVWAPIVGTRKISGDQLKWESESAELLLNGTDCGRSVL